MPRGKNPALYEVMSMNNKQMDEAAELLAEKEHLEDDYAEYLISVDDEEDELISNNKNNINKRR